MIRLRDLLLILLKAQKFDFKDMDVLCSIIELFTSQRLYTNDSNYHVTNASQSLTAVNARA